MCYKCHIINCNMLIKCNINKIIDNNILFSPPPFFLICQLNKIKFTFLDLKTFIVYKNIYKRSQNTLINTIIIFNSEILSYFIIRLAKQLFVFIYLHYETISTTLKLNILFIFKD